MAAYTFEFYLDTSTTVVKAGCRGFCVPDILHLGASENSVVGVQLLRSVDQTPLCTSIRFCSITVV